ncbi:Polyketide synthase PksN [Pseudovibrio axinellae]|uniref:Polyketide synthase PksN n=1 Tax=Pseudovibrio axinellae TaxID=989403 RepID=A0A165U0R4_9HYPH|nr:SDR family NAD(P)-dependent oxidoreductase [Pseudovibrio axinellae]KZL09105.1 Polyketide synthase PksN [Pseudovibrio axinellae]SER75486.1 polyketide synthase PksJ/polyketide synthase PksN [Pseudovibrio axinellae]
MMLDTPILSPDGLRQAVLGNVAELLNCPVESLDLDLGLGHQGFNSLHYALLSTSLGDLVGRDIRTSDLLAVSSLNELLAFAQEAAPSRPAIPVEPEALVETGPVSSQQDTQEDDIAVIGLYCRMPQADGPDAFWQNIVNGRDCITQIPGDRWDWRTFYGNDPERNESQIRWGGFLSDIDCFDPTRFNISPREANAMDPRQRLLLEGSWGLMEDAGYAPQTGTSERVGVFLGVTGDEYGSMLAASGAAQDQLTLIGTGRSFIANRVNYAFNWSGPSEVIDTTCSSSLVAIHHAVNALKNGDCNMAVAGGISVLIDPLPHIALSKVGVLAEDGRCKTFDDRANGYVRSEGLGLVLLKPLAQALEDGDNVQAVIKACRINHGGRSSAMTAPNVAAQKALLSETFVEVDGGIGGLGYHESHGTGTRLGDPIEITAYGQAVAGQIADEGLSLLDQHISVGSVKTSIGHCEAAAGVAGFIKAMLALKHSVKPPLVHFKDQNTEISTAGTPLTFESSAREWQASIGPQGLPRARCASLSAFGFGGVNACAVIEEAPQSKLGKPIRLAGPQLFLLSGRTPELLRSSVQDLLDWLPGADGRAARLIDIAFTLQQGRVHDKHRLAVVAETAEDLTRQLSAALMAGLGDLKHDKHQNEALRRALDVNDLHAAAKAWEQGGAVNWPEWARQLCPDGIRISLPKSQFLRKRYWLPQLEQTKRDGLTGWAEADDLKDNGLRLRLTSRDGFYAQHVIAGSLLLPGAGFLSAIELACHRHKTTYAPVHLEDITFRQPFSLKEAPAADLLVLLEDGEGATNVSVTANDETHSLCTARLKEDAMASRKSGLAEARRAYANVTTAAQREKIFTDLGISYGPLFQVITDMWWSGDEALARVSIPDLPSAEPGCGVSIPLLDGLFQTILLHQSFSAGTEETRVPFNISTLCVYSQPGTNGYVRVRPVRDASGQRQRYDALLYDKEGALSIEMLGVLGHQIPAQNPASDKGEVVPLVPAWASIQAINSSTPARMALLDLSGSFEPDALLSGGEFVQITAELSEAAATDWLKSGEEKLTVLLGAGGRYEGDFLKQAALFLKACLSQPVPNSRSVLFVELERSLKDQSVIEGLAALGKAVELENPAFSVKTLQVDPLAAPQLNAVLAPVHELKHSNSFRLMPRGLQQRVLRSADLTSKTKGMVEPEGGLYLVTGGFGAIGRHFVSNLAKAGATVLALGRSPQAEENLTREEATAERIHYAQVDCSHYESLQAAISNARMQFGPVRGVLHCAGITPGGLLVRRTSAEIAMQIAVKLDAVRYLDEITADDAPNLFAAFSSLIAHSGIIGCSDYALANRAMEAYVAQRASSRSGRSFSIAWSAWPEGGMSLRPEQEGRIRREGILPIPPQAAIAAAEAVFATPDLTTAVLPYGHSDLIIKRFTENFMTQDRGTSSAARGGMQ